jgi:hypothetical protein
MAKNDRNGKSKGKSKRLVVYTIIESNDKSFWRPIGAAFVNQDDSLTVLLDALPVNARLHIRERSEEDGHGESEGRD